MLQVGYDFATPWIAIAIAGWLVISVVSATMLRPLAARVIAALEGRSDDAMAGVARLVIVERVLIAMLVLLIVDMTTKPFA